MLASSPIPVGSSIFFSFTLLLISIVVLLLLRRFLTLRATPAYLIIPIFLALALPASVVLLVPIDLASSSRDGSGPKAIWLPDRLLLVTWRIAYWLIFVLTWAILPLLGEYVDSGYRDPKGRLQYSIRSNARYQLIVLGCAFVGLIYISIQNGFKFGSIKGLVMALAYVWGLVLAIYLMGHGLVSIPRTLFRNANVSGRLRRVQAHAPRLHDRLMDAINDLESLESQVSQLQRRKTGSAREFQDWIEELAEPSGTPEARTPLLAPSEESSTVPNVITERYLADLTRRLQRARHQKARFIDEWDRLVLLAADLQAIINSSASKKLEFNHSPHRSTFWPRVKILTPYMRYHVYVHLVPKIRLLLGAVFTVASVCVVWSELIKSLAPRLSVVTLSIVSYHKDPAPVNFGRQVTASAWLLYMCWAALVGVNDAKVWGNRALVRRNTYGESACWYASLVARLTVPIAYNFLTFLPTAFRQSTTFYHLLGRFIDLTPLGKGFDYFFPVFILLPVCATLFNLYGRVKNICGFGLIEEDDEDMDNNPGGYGLGGWREGRDLIERELTGLGSLGLSGRGVSPRATSRSDEGTGAFSTSRTPRTEAIRPARPVRGPATASAVLDGEEEEENFFQSFAHRVRNTFETADKPQWLQGDFLRLPRWMGNDSSEGNSGLGRWFGGRPTPGGTSLGETCASYVDYIADHLPPSVQKFVLSAKASSPPTWISEYLRSFDTTTPTTLLPLTALSLVLSGAIIFAIMSSWRDFFRRGPAYSHVANPPLVTEQDYDYIAPTSDAHGDTEPDIVLLRHRRHTYELQFPPYAINEGRLSVGQLRRHAAEVTHTADPHRIKLLYKGTLLDDDARPCCDEGLKQHSEVLCVVSEVAPGQRTPSEGPSDDTSESVVAPPAPLSGEEGEAPRRRTRNRGKKGKKAKKNQKKDAEDEGRLAPPTATAESSRPSSAGGGSSSMPALAPNLKMFATAGEQVQALLSYLRSELTPLCEEYIARPPADAKARDFEHKKLSETILAQVILKADGIEPASEEERMARRALVKEALTISGRLDQAAKE
ncbi:LMBR1-like membrane protein-domain-containing protein [Aspergillus terreus]|uniref:LMBR1-like membrane protein-domain-containing protein n=1 Tax=Aspergillus terreus TaxID=33178 RepID=A0A5M3YXM8_ASPTE|nr:hypothetical protein ATETN484_0005023700 [Aspergillus terreus]GFF16902.1 LMBR1-like membrane protein-domain-containing protein [Aspergillus terreus]